ncbi:multiple coagulation factor deficiency protein 2 homolog [Amphibalanus amphitrite]|uniref:multiple coagulation factor deficiency protein 2 homolog n=1 Tax=Amphibalanus amphitrite TaxID=1232801 RepID=UPI001C909180|nr:multiple coagulation factor deficiency protein 2 homolog [Amphibalanus amphitrite]
MILPVYVSRKKPNPETFEELPGIRETMLQAVLVALLACLVWGGPSTVSPNSQDSEGGGTDYSGTVLASSEDVTQHLEGAIDPQSVANLTEDELRYHYFQSHDFDGNKALDGMEMLKAVLHAAPEKTSNMGATEDIPDSDSEQDQGNINVPSTAQFYVGVIDRVLGEGDLNKDGFLSYPEYVLVNRRAQQRQNDEHMQDPA